MLENEFPKLQVNSLEENLWKLRLGEIIKVMAASVASEETPRRRTFPIL